MSFFDAVVKSVDSAIDTLSDAGSAPSSTPSSPSSAAKKHIDIKTATRDELVTFLRDQNTHVQKLQSVTQRLKLQNKEASLENAKLNSSVEQLQKEAAQKEEEKSHLQALLREAAMKQSSLKRDAEREQEKLKNEIEEKYEKVLGEMSLETARLKEENEALFKEVAALRGRTEGEISIENGNNENDNDILKERNDELEREVERLKKEIDENPVRKSTEGDERLKEADEGALQERPESDQDKMLDEINELKTELKGLESAVEERDRCIAELKEATTRSQSSELAALQERIETLGYENESLKRGIYELRVRNEELEDVMRKEDVNRALSEAKDVQERLETVINDLKEEQIVSQSQFRDDLERLEREKAAAESKLSELGDLLAASQTKEEKLRELLKRAQGHINEQKQALGALVEEKETLIAEKEALNDALIAQGDRIRSEVGMELKRAFESELEMARQNFERLQHRQSAVHASESRELQDKLSEITNQYESYKARAQSLIAQGTRDETSSNTSSRGGAFSDHHSRHSSVSSSSKLSNSSNNLRRSASFPPEMNETDVSSLILSEEREDMEKATVSALQKELGELRALLIGHEQRKSELTRAKENVKELEVELVAAQKREAKALGALQQAKAQWQEKWQSSATTHSKQIREMNERYERDIAEVTTRYEQYKQESALLLQTKEKEITTLKDLLEVARLRQSSNAAVAILETNTTPLLSKKEMPLDRSQSSFMAFSELQSTKETELKNARAKVGELEALLADVERMLELKEMQEKVLKEEIRKLEASQERVRSLSVDDLKDKFLIYLSDRTRRPKMVVEMAELLRLTSEEKKSLETHAVALSTSNKSTAPSTMASTSGLWGSAVLRGTPLT